MDWHKPPRAQKLQRRVQLTGELARGALNDKVYALYEPPAPSGSPTTRTDARPATPRWSGATIRWCRRRWSSASGLLPTATLSRAPVRADARRAGQHQAAAGGHQNGGSRGRSGDAQVPRTMTTSCSANRPRRAAAQTSPKRRRHRRHHRGPAGPGFVLRGGARATREASSTPPRMSSPDWSPNTAGESASSLNHMRWWKTCCRARSTPVSTTQHPRR